MGSPAPELIDRDGVLVFERPPGPLAWLGGPRTRVDASGVRVGWLTRIPRDRVACVRLYASPGLPLHLVVELHEASAPDVVLWAHDDVSAQVRRGFETSTVRRAGLAVAERLGVPWVDSPWSEQAFEAHRLEGLTLRQQSITATQRENQVAWAVLHEAPPEEAPVEWFPDGFTLTWSAQTVSVRRGRLLAPGLDVDLADVEGVHLRFHQLGERVHGELWIERDGWLEPVLRVPLGDPGLGLALGKGRGAGALRWVGDQIRSAASTAGPRGGAGDVPSALEDLAGRGRTP